MTRSRVARTAREVLLTSGAVVGALCLLLAMAALALGLTPLVFRSGSMSPAIDTGALALARSVEAVDLAEGDIVSVHNAAGSRITHRVVAVAGSGDARELTLQGDANDVPDAETYVVTEADRVFVSVPGLGYAVGWLSGPIGLFLLGAYAMFLLSVLWRPVHDAAEEDDHATSGPGRRRAAGGRRSRAGGTTHPGGGRRRAERRRAGKTGLVVTSVILVGAGSMGTVLGRATSTLAAFTDTVPVTAGYAATTVPAPGSFGCNPGGFLTYRVTFSWAAVAGATSYTVHYGAGGAQTASTTATSYTYQGPFFQTTNGTAWVEAHRNFGSTTWISPASSSLPYTTALFPDC